MEIGPQLSLSQSDMHISVSDTAYEKVTHRDHRMKWNFHTCLVVVNTRQQSVSINQPGLHNSLGILFSMTL